MHRFVGHTPASEPCRREIVLRGLSAHHIALLASRPLM
jgi:hypothetical protein